MSRAIFWLCAFGLFYIYLGYPLLIWALALIRPKPRAKAPWTRPVSVVVVAFNEAHNLARKIRSLLESRDAGLISEILIGSDGSTDATREVVEGVADPRVRLIEFGERRGKASVLNDVVPLCASEVVVLTDARQELHPDSLGILLSAFADEKVGVVSGELVFRDSAGTAASEGIGVYWRYEKFIRRQESAFDSVPGATGALYAIRKELFRQIPPTTVLDDVAIPMQAVMQGCRCVFEENALVYDDTSKTPEQEAVRKRRTIAGNIQLVLLRPDLLLPMRNPIWVQFVSHKIARLVSPFFLFGLLVVSLFLRHVELYHWILCVQIAVYVLALVGWATQKMTRQLPMVGIPLMFVNLNAVTLHALWDAANGRYRIAWRTGREDLSTSSRGD